MLNTNLIENSSLIGAVVNSATGNEPKRVADFDEPTRPSTSIGVDYMTRQPRSNYYGKLEKMDDKQLQNEVKQQYIFLHMGGDRNASWKVDAVEFECTRRRKTSIYDAGYDEAANTDLSTRM